MTTRAAPPALAVDDTPAGQWRRVLATLVDQVVWLVLGGGVALLAVLRSVPAAGAAGDVLPAVPGPVLAAAGVLGLLVTLVQWVLHGRRGWTVGRLLLGIRTVDVHSRRPVGMVRVLVRGLVVAVGVLACGLGQYVVLLSPLLDRTGRRRGWHDRAVDAEVLLAAPAGRTAGVGLPGREGAGETPSVGRTVPSSPGPDAPPPAPPAHAAPLRPDVPRAASSSPDVVPSSPGSSSDAASSDAASPDAAASTPVAAPPTGGLVLAPLDPQRAAPDLDTQAIPLVRPTPTLAFGLSPELEMTRPAPPRADVVPESRGPHGLQVTLDDGRTVTVERLALVGRNPTPTPGVQVVRVVDPERSVSKVHLQLVVDEGGGAWVVDRGSTNGTLVTLPDGAQVVCRVDHPVRLREGAVVDFGDRSLRVDAMPSRPA